ncbi:MAG: ATP-binding protein [Acidobacteriota bacterium]|nr:ATP-binding protein [Acidobacteriota bacterium]MDH3525522.1 ATP-binding protein [Acidobacteriota bacterium]
MDPSAPISDEPPRPSRRPRPLRGLAWLVGAGLLVSLTAWWAAGLARERALGDLRQIDSETMKLVVSNLRVELEKLEFMPQLVARDERIQRLLERPGDPELVAAANGYLEEISRTVGASDTYVMDVGGLTLAASNWASDASFVGQDFGFRPYFKEALEGLAGRYFARGAASNKRGYYFACPIHRDGQIIGVAAVKVGFEAIERTWRDLPGPIALTDWHGIVFATNEPGWLYRSLRRLDERTFAEVNRSRRYSGVVLDPSALVEIQLIDGTTSRMTVLAARDGAGGPRRPGAEYLALSDDLPEYGWVIYTMSSLRAVDGSVRAAAALGAASAGLLALAAFFLAQRRQYRRQRASFREREQRMLRRNQEELERRIAERTADLMRSNQQLQKEIAEHEIAERALRDTQQGLVQAAKLAALGQLAAGVTHELNQPLTALRSYADNARLLIGRQRLDEAARNLERITRLTDRMASITRHLKTFSRKTGPDRREPVDVVRALEAALSLVGVGGADGGLELLHAKPAEKLLVLGDPVRLEQVFVNLIKNACEALAGAERRQLSIGYRAGEEAIEIEIRDSGPGIRREHLGRVFEPFFTTKEAGEGLGLGLSITASILGEMGGSVRAGNHPAGGAAFTVALPRAVARAQARSA